MHTASLADAFQVHGFHDFGWINPKETFGGIVDPKVAEEMWENGAFVYRFRGGGSFALHRMDYHADAHNEDKAKMSNFERVTRAAVVGNDELKRVLSILQAELPASSTLDGTQGSRRLHSTEVRVQLLNSPSLGWRETPEERKRRFNDSITGKQPSDATVEGVRGQGVTPLMWAAEMGIPRAAQVLLDAYCAGNPNIPKALVLALRHENQVTASVILGHRLCFWLSMLADEQVDEEMRLNDAMERSQPRDAVSAANVSEGQKRLLTAVAKLVAQEASQQLVPRQVVRMVTTQGIGPTLYVCRSASRQPCSTRYMV